MKKQNVSYELMIVALGRVVWCFTNSGVFWLIHWLTDTSLRSGDVWLLGFAVGLITWQIAPVPERRS